MPKILKPNSNDTDDDGRLDAETALRRDAALRRALGTPPQPKHGKGRESNPATPDRAPGAKPGKRGRPAEGS